MKRLYRQALPFVIMAMAISLYFVLQLFIKARLSVSLDKNFR